MQVFFQNNLDMTPFITFLSTGLPYLDGIGNPFTLILICVVVFFIMKRNEKKGRHYK